MISPWRRILACTTWVLCAGAAFAQPKLLGVDYAGADSGPVEKIAHEPLPGALKMSGTWVSKLGPSAWARAATQFCRYAAAHRQAAYVQLPVAFTSKQVVAALEHLAAIGCRPAGFSIGNEVDRLVTEKIAPRYAPADYVADYNRIAPLVARHFPSASIIALELSSFMILEWRDEQAPAVKYRPIFDWLVPFCKASLARRPDYVSVHFYPFTGAQKEWETLSAGRQLARIMQDLEPQLARCAPLLIGEFNATYQYEDSTIYPGSGGESFMAALALPAILAHPRVAGLFHWSLVESAPSVLGLFQGDPPVAMPLYEGYRLARPVAEKDAHALASRRAAIEAYGSTRGAAIVNASPFFRRNVTVSGASDADVAFPGVERKLLLAPFSLTAWEGEARPMRIAYADRAPRPAESADPSRAWCSTLADFAEKRFPARHFENERYNQNRKIASGGTYVALASPGAAASVEREADDLLVRCRVPAAGAAYYQCGVKLPLVADALADRRAGADWSEGLDTGSLRITLAAPVETELQVHVEGYDSAAMAYNTHHKVIAPGAATTIEVPLRELRQDPSYGLPRSLREVLRNAAAVRVETRSPGFAGEMRLRRVEVCDAP